MGGAVSRVGKAGYYLYEKIFINAVERLLKRQKQEFDKRQEVLEHILNRGRPLIDKQPHLGHIKMPIAPRGKGKSTVCNIFEGTKFPTGDSTEDVTMCMESKVFPDKVIVDTVGMDVTLENIGKIFLLFFIHGIFPDYFIHIDDVSILRRSAATPLSSSIRCPHPHARCVPACSWSTHPFSA